jgi:hypothetical protein
MTKIIKLPNGGVLKKYPDGGKSYYLNGNLHREDGPAIEFLGGYKEWYINGRKVYCTTQEQFEQLMRLKAFW